MAQAAVLDGPEFGQHLRAEIGRRMRRRRGELGLTQPDLAAKLLLLGLKQSVSDVSRMEKSGPSGTNTESKVAAYAQALSCTPTYLQGWTEDPQSWEPDRSLAKVVDDLATRVLLNGKAPLRVVRGGKKGVREAPPQRGLFPHPVKQ